MSKQKKQYQNKRTQKKTYTKPSPRPAAQEPIDQEFIDRYGQGGILKNTLKIWRDSSKVTFLAYFPVILLELLYCVVWFCASIFVFIPATRTFGGHARDAVVFINVMICVIGLPILLTWLHLRYNLKQKRYYFTNAFRYILPASALYWALHFINIYISFMFDENRTQLLKAQLETSMYMGLVMIAAIAIFGCVAQVVLLWKRNKEEPLTVRLAVGTRHGKEKPKK